MKSLEGLFNELKAHPPKFFIGDTVYTIHGGDVVKCFVDSITIEWEVDELFCRYNLYTEEDANGNYDLLYGYDEDTFADEASAKKEFIVPQLKEDIRKCGYRIADMQGEIERLRAINPEERVKELEECIAAERRIIARKEEQLKEYKEE